MRWALARKLIGKTGTMTKSVYASSQGMNKELMERIATDGQLEAARRKLLNGGKR